MLSSQYAAHDTGQTLSRSYGRCFAEFLNEGSPDHLGILYPSTCVGLRYGCLQQVSETFLVGLAQWNRTHYTPFHSCFIPKD
jgi:hypothetical protein